MSFLSSAVLPQKILSRFALLLCFLLTSMLLASGAPVIRVDKPDHDFGVIYRGAKAEHVFTLHNEGSGILKINNVKSSCGCTVPSIDKRTLNPGESTELKAVFDSRRFKGNIRKNIFVYSNDPATPVKKLSIQVEVRMDIEVSPSTIYLSGLKIGEKVEKKISLKNISENSISVQEIASTIPAITLNLSKIKIAPGDSADLYLVVDELTKDMKLSGALTIFNSSHQKELKVQIYSGAIR